MTKLERCVLIVCRAYEKTNALNVPPDVKARLMEQAIHLVMKEYDLELQPDGSYAPRRRVDVEA